MTYSYNKLGIYVVKMLWDVPKCRRNSFSTSLKCKTYVKTVEQYFLHIWGKKITAHHFCSGLWMSQSQNYPKLCWMELWVRWPSVRCLCPQLGGWPLRLLSTLDTLWFYDCFDFVANSLKVKINVKKGFVVGFFNPILKIFLPSTGKKTHNNGNVSSCAYSRLKCIFDILVLLLIHKLRS